MKIYEHADDIFSELDSHKRVSKMSLTEEDVKNWLAYVDRVNNNVGDYSSVIDESSNVETFKIPKELKGLFYPARIVQDPARDAMCLNLLVKEELSETEIPKDYDYDDFVRTTSRIYSALRQTPTFDVPLSQVRTIDQVANYVNRTMIGDKDDGFYTLIRSDQTDLPVSLSIELYQDYAYGMSKKDYILQMIRNIIQLIIN
jgi:hypothetical protein